MLARLVLLAASAFVQLGLAAPVIEPRDGVTAVAAATVTDLTIYAQFSRAAYCPSTKILSSTSSWSCGEACDALPGFIPYITGGNNKNIPLYFVGYWPVKNMAVVVHEGTDPTQFLSLLTDANIFMTTLSTNLFPGVPSTIEVHEGFATAQAAEATTILATVKKILADHSTNKVTVVGHSLGAAVGTLDAVYLKANLPSSTVFKVVLHGSPRVGNQAFADYIDANFSDFTRVNHGEDPIPIVPGRFLGFHHPGGEDHIDHTDATSWVSCSGQDNEDDRCSTGDVENILAGNILDHLGPYSVDGITIGTLWCY